MLPPLLLPRQENESQRRKSWFCKAVGTVGCCSSAQKEHKEVDRCANGGEPMSERRGSEVAFTLSIATASFRDTSPSELQPQPPPQPQPDTQVGLSPHEVVVE